MEKTEINKTPRLKKAFSGIFYVFLCFVSALSVALACLLLSVAVKNPVENTIKLFGYKIYTCDNNIEGTQIKAGSLIIIKDSDNDEYYTPQQLSQSALVFENLGDIIKHHSTSAVLVALIPVMLLFIVVLMRELSKKIMKNEQKLLDTEMEFVQTESFEEEKQTQNV